MLTSEHAIVDYSAGRAVPDRLGRSRHGHYLGYAGQALAVYRRGIGRPRRELHRRVEAVFADEPDCPTRRIQAFCKLLDDRSTYRTDPAGEASRLRLKLFSAAARYHPLVTRPDRLFEHAEADVKARLAAELSMTWPEIELKLYVDVMAQQPLQACEGYADAAALLARYNVAQLQACLFRARSLTVEVADDFKTVLRYAKLARLLHEIVALGPSRYRITLSGPTSVLRQTRRYGVNLARFLPALLACEGWRMTAVVETPWKTTAELTLTDRVGFTGHLPRPGEFDSGVEEAFAARFGPRRDGWTLIREGEILHDRQTVFVPDFVFQHDDGARVPMEIVGFWTPQYLESKRRTLRRFGGHRILIALPERSLRPGVAVGPDVVLYKTALKVAPILEALERVRQGRQRPSHSGG